MKYLKSILESDGSSKLKDVIDSIRAVFVDFEDSRIISYSDLYAYVYRPGENNYERFISLLIDLAEKRKEFDHIKIDCAINIPVFHEKFLNENGIGVLEDVLIAIKRLENLGYSVIMDLNSNHHLYKPVHVTVKIPMSLL